MDNHELHVVFGAGGSIGHAVVRELVKQGRRVRGVTRSGKADAPAGVEMLKGDASDPDSARQACRGASVIYNCANAPYRDWPRQFPPIMAGLVEGASSANAKLVFADNLYTYGNVSGPITESTPNKATGKKGRTRILMAKMLMDAHAAGKVRAAIGRASDYYGPGVTNSAVYQFEAVLAGKAAMWIGRLDAPHSLSYAGDVARGLITLGEHDEALGGIWHIPAAEALTGRQFLQLVFEEAGLPPKIGARTRAMMRLVSPFMPVAREALETLYQFEAPFVVDGGRFMRAFGFAPTPHREAIRQTLKWFRER